MTTSRSRPADELPGTAARQPARALIERTILDQQVARAREADPRPWGVLPWLGPLLTSAAIIVVGQLVGGAVARQGRVPLGIGIGMTVAAEGLMMAALFAFGRGIAARGGGWRTALGLDRIRAADWAPWGLGLAFVYIGRSTVGLLANALSGGRALAQASNLHLTRPGPVAVLGLALTVVVLAPVTEELMFRGLLLRSFMHRLSFWPAALLSTALFGAMHVYEVRTALGAVTLATSVGVLGLGNCYLVRITGRLTPGIMVHAAFNAVALAVAVLLAYR
ncbi:MAG: protease family protein [Blastococcus sp.]|jgi:membrane protease YdiL (CAAX protease family)|nr:protease family protein [Blastococcus sp.]